MKKIKTKVNGLFEMLTTLTILGAISSIIILIVLSFLVAIFASTDASAAFWSHKYLFMANKIYELILINIFYLLIFLNFIAGIVHSVLTHKGVKHELLIVGIDFINLIRGKKLHSIIFLEYKFSKLAYKLF